MRQSTSVREHHISRGPADAEVVSFRRVVILGRFNRVFMLRGHTRNKRFKRPKGGGVREHSLGDVTLCAPLRLALQWSHWACRA